MSRSNRATNSIPGSKTKPNGADARGSSSGSELDDEAEDGDDLSDLKVKIEAMMLGSEERKMGVREYKRLKKIPPGSVENGVIRNYVHRFRPLSVLGLD